MKKIVIASIATLALATASIAAAVNAKSCIGCHGVDWSKKAMNKSIDVSNMTHAEIEASLLSFKAGTSGTVMKGFVKRHTEKELKDFAQTIGK